jgi:hypothetical protein
MNTITLHQFKNYKGLDLIDTTSDMRMLDTIRAATADIEHYKQRHYDPRIQTRRLEIPRTAGSLFGVFDSSLAVGSPKEPTLRLADDLLEVIELKNGDGSVIPTGSYELLPAGSSPSFGVRLIGESWCGGEDDRIELTGVWGTHEAYESAWMDSLDTIQDIGGISASATVMTVGDADGAAGDLQSPRFQVGQLIRMDSEYCLALGVDTSHNQVSLARHQNGSTAATHAAGTSIQIWRPQANVVTACLRLAGWRWSQKDVDNYDKTYNVGSGVVTYPSALPADVVQLLGARTGRI